MTTWNQLGIKLEVFLGCLQKKSKKSIEGNWNKFNLKNISQKAQISHLHLIKKQYFQQLWSLNIIINIISMIFVAIKLKHYHEHSSNNFECKCFWKLRYFVDYLIIRPDPHLPSFPNNLIDLSQWCKHYWNQLTNK